MIIHGDCIEEMKKIPSNSIDCCISDVPYKIIAGGVRVVYEDDEVGLCLNKRDWSKTDPKGVLGGGKKVVATCKDPKMKKDVEYRYNNKRTRKVVSDGTACSNKRLKKGNSDVVSAVKDGKMFIHNDVEFHERLPELYRIMKDKSHTYLMINGRNLKDLQIEAEKVGFKYQNLLVRMKGNATPNKYYMQGAEFILMFTKNGSKNINDMGSTNIIDIPNIIGNKDHPTQKPVGLYKYLIKNSTQKGETVIDPFAGSGPLIEACIQLKRKYIAIEIDEEYYSLCLAREKNIQGSLFS